MKICNKCIGRGQHRKVVTKPVQSGTVNIVRFERCDSCRGKGYLETRSNEFRTKYKTPEVYYIPKVI